MSPRRALVIAVSLVAVGAAAWTASTRASPRRFARATLRHLQGRRARFATDADVDRFLRGNVHTHSRVSDGTSPIEAVVGWYRDHGYAFLAMTEHNVRVDPATLATAAGPGMVVIAGEEVTDKVRGLPLHVNSLCARDTVGGDVDFDRADVGLAQMIAAVRAHGGVPLVNHPNFHWAIDAGDLARGAQGPYLLEIWSGHPNVSPGGDASHASAESLWDDALARDADVAPAAVDDTHNLPGDPGGDALPGRAWIETFGDERTPEAICAALAEGRLYASTGPELKRIAVHGDTFAVDVADPGATIAFIGERGEVLAQTGASASYRLGGGEVWVRARITSTNGARAWTPAFRVEAE